MNEENKILLIFAYLLTWLSGIIVYLYNDNKNSTLRFHSLQAIFLGILITVISVFSFVLIPPVRYIAYIFTILLWLYGVYVGFQAYNGKNISIPVIGEMAKR